MTSYDKDLEELETMLKTELPEIGSEKEETEKISKKDEKVSKKDEKVSKKDEKVSKKEEKSNTEEDIKPLEKVSRISIFNKAKLFIKQKIYIFFGIVFGISLLTLSIIKPSFIMTDITPKKEGEAPSDPKKKKINMIYMVLTSLFISAVISIISFVYLKKFSIN